MDQTCPVVHKSRRPQARLKDSHTVLHTLWSDPRGGRGRVLRSILVLLFGRRTQDLAGNGIALL
jgi:hypothetical protein